MKKTLLLIINLFLVSATNAQTPPCFSARVDYTTAPTVMAVVSADFNGDGNKDLAVANGGANNVSVLLGSATGTFGTPTNFAVGTSPASITFAYINGDSNIDLVVGNFNSNNISILMGSGNGTFSTAINYAVGTFPRSVCSADFNGDGNSDIAVANQSSNNISILLGSATGTFAPVVNYPGGSAPQGIISGFFNADANVDLAIVSVTSNNMHVYMGSGTGTFSPAVSYGVVGAQPLGLTSGDFNNDGKTDIAAAVSGAGGGISIFLGSTTGTFSPAVNIPSANSGGPKSIISKDFNNDGKADLALAKTSTNDVSIFMGSGTGTFVAGVSYTVGATPWTLTSADFNNDGKMDLATANSGTNTASVLLNTIPTVTANSGSICVGQSFTITPGGNVISFTVTGGNYIVTPTVTTMYSVTGTNSLGCVGIATSSVTVSICTDIRNNTAEQYSEINVYPNPNNGNFIISLSHDSNISITDVLGRQIYYENLNYGEHTINLENEIPGLYFIRTTVEGHAKITKMIKN
ncbi:MAG: T9SS type A sorting domain-containing protein [Bacteroidetes bacterium]|nr:T9SS type A sorting domain-containing protein [Bacteroidota bacterium]